MKGGIYEDFNKEGDHQKVKSSSIYCIRGGNDDGVPTAI